VDDCTGKVVLITGAASGCGQAVAQIMSALPVGRMLRPEELCAAVRYLCSDEARFMTGTTLLLDGGFTAQ
jgi:NAD(P)-dependent dehydrogenase (short-subunit alcohol dehydrogenase family)